MKNTKRNLYQEVTDTIIAELEKGVIPWKKPWSSFGLASNYVSKKAYQGINMFLLNFCVNDEYPFYLTFKQAKELGGSVRKGAKSRKVYYFNMIFKDADGKKITPEQASKDENSQVAKYIKYYSVFNIKDVEGIDFELPGITLTDNDPIQNCEKIIKDYTEMPQVEHNESNKAFYNMLKDYINMPLMNRFNSSEEYYQTLFHEIIHSTGSNTRLSRMEITKPQKFGSSAYSKEELVAEIGASFLSNIAGIESQTLIENSTAYIQGWLKNLNNGDTFYAESETTRRTKFRLIGIDAPESKHPNKPVEAFSKKASEYLKRRIEGKKVLLEYDVQKKDRYQRTLVYVYTVDTSFINAEMVRSGLAQVFTFPPNIKYVDVFLEDQQKARAEGAGIWSR